MMHRDEAFLCLNEVAMPVGAISTAGGMTASDSERAAGAVDTPGITEF
jgi:hypothetical protein